MFTNWSKDLTGGHQNFTDLALPDTVVRVVHSGTTEAKSSFSPKRCRISLSQALGFMP